MLYKFTQCYLCTMDLDIPEGHKSGYVNIIGKPNVGKSTLINALIGEKLSIVTPKAQTTRHRILGILNEPQYQIVFSDTPGIIESPKYMLHEMMMKFVHESLTDADVMLYMVDVWDIPGESFPFLKRIIDSGTPLMLVLNKIDESDQEKTVDLIAKWAEIVPEENIIPISALKKFNTQSIIVRSLELLPEAPPYFDKEQYTDKSERFITSEVIREKIFTRTRQEIPYSVEVVVTSFKEEEGIIFIAAEIIANRATQKPILIGRGGETLKRIGTDARKDLEIAFQKKVFLEMFVKVRENWRENKNFLRQFGYDA